MLNPQTSGWFHSEYVDWHLYDAFLALLTFQNTSDE